MVRVHAEIALIILERRLIAAPVGMELAHPVLKQPEPSRIEDQVGRAAGLAPGDQAGIFQDLDVLVDRRKGQASHPGKLADGAGLQAKDVDDFTPVRIRERLQHAVQHDCGVVCVCHVT